MKLATVTGELTRFRNNPWRLQKTYLTPIEDVKRFVSAILTTLPINEGNLSIDTFVFDPETLLRLLAEHSIECQSLRNAKITASGQDEVAALLESAFGEWLDFLFVPTPKTFAIYADHDEYSTFFANTRSNLSKLEGALKSRGYKPVGDYRRFTQSG